LLDWLICDLQRSRVNAVAMEPVASYVSFVPIMAPAQASHHGSRLAPISHLFIHEPVRQQFQHHDAHVSITLAVK